MWRSETEVRRIRSIKTLLKEEKKFNLLPTPGAMWMGPEYSPDGNIFITTEAKAAPCNCGA